MVTDPRDLAAMKRAVEELEQTDPNMLATLRDHGRSELEIGEFAAAVCQIESLGLRPWECAPAETINTPNPKDAYGFRPSEVTLLQRMLRAGVSRFHPDPIAALGALEVKDPAV